ncbi:MAG: transposase [Sphingobium sp.]
MDDGDIFEHMPVTAGGDIVQRMDVIASAQGRRSWTAEAKGLIIAESMVPGVNVAEVARRHDMQPQHLYMWRRTAMERMGSRDQPAFVPVTIEEVDRPLSARSVADLDGRCSEISIDLCGVVLRIPDGVSADHIERALLAVRAVS